MLRMKFKRLVCKILGHKPQGYVWVELLRHPLPEGIIGIAHEDSYVECERCGKRLS